MKCAKCGNEFEGKFCPECGTPANIRPEQSSQVRQPVYGYGQYTASSVQKKKKKPIAVVGIIFGSIIVLFILIAAFTPSSGENTNKQANATTTQTSSKSLTDGAIKVDYKVLYKDYADNPINADKKYKDKELILTGTIANIDRDISKSPYITFNIDEYGAKSIKMAFSDDDTVAKLKKGQTVTVTGNCSGTFVSTIVVLDNCAVVK